VPRTPSDFVGPLLEDEIQFYDQYGAMPFGEGGMLYSDGYFYAEDQYGVFNLRQDVGSGGGVGTNAPGFPAPMFTVNTGTHYYETNAFFYNRQLYSNYSGGLGNKCN